MKKIVTLLLLLGMVCTASADDKYVVAGSLDFTGAFWSTTDERNLMTDNGDGTYSITYSNIFLFKSDVGSASEYADKGNRNYKFKVVKNGSWDTAYPANDYEFWVNNSGIYDITITYNSSNNNVTETTTWKSDATSAFFLYGNMISGTYDSWDYNYPQYRIIDNSVTIDASDISEDIEIKWKWTDGSNWGGVSGGYTVTNGVASDVSWGYDNSYGNIVIPQSTLKCSKYVISINTSDSKFSVQGYEKVKTNGYGYCTYSSTNPVNIPGNAYYATDRNNGSARAIPLTGNVAARTAMLVKGNTNTEFSFAVAASGTSYTASNAFKAGDATTAESGLSSGTGPYNYILNDDKFKAANGQTVGTNKAYLQLSAPANPARVLIFPEDDDTGISEIEATRNVGNEKFYNLSGQRIANPTKGLYIVNGKKIVVR